MAKILVVDDQRNMRTALAMMLRGAGHDVEEATDGDEACEKVVSEVYDLVLTDLTMPGMNGIELLRKARALRPELVGVVMSGNAELTGADVEGWKVLQKPFLAQELLEAVETALSRLA